QPAHLGGFTMHTLNKTLLTGVAGAAVLAAVPAMAADLAVKAPRVAPVVPPIPIFSWTGCFVGAHVGWGWGKKDFNVLTNLSHEAHIDSSRESATRNSGSVDTSGPIFGGQLGCDWQFGAGKAPGAGAWVIGIQGSVSGADINGVDATRSDDGFIHAK